MLASLADFAVRAGAELSRRNLKKILPMAARIVTGGVVPPSRWEHMRTFKRFPPRGLRFRLLLILAGALLLLAAFVPRANADLIAYFNFEGTPTPPYPVDLTSSSPGVFSTTLTTTYPAADTSSTSGIALNVAPGDPDQNLTAFGLMRTEVNSPADFDIPLFTSQGFFQTMTVTFATDGRGNGFTAVQLFYSTNGGGTFTAGPSVTLTQRQQLVTLSVPVGANNAPSLVLRLQFTGGQSSGNDLQTWIDNIQVNGTIVPEPATVAGGLLGVLGLCWHQRRRLIRSMRFRSTRTPLI
jgi:hypothetical protein